MTPLGHIELGPYTSIKPLILDKINGFGWEGANPYSAPSGGNQGYNDLQGWSEWTMNNWQAGAGTQDPEAGGFLFSTLETRVPNQIILPQITWPTMGKITVGDTDAYQEFYNFVASGSVTVGPSPAAIRKYGYSLTTSTPDSGFSTGGTYIGSNVLVYCKGAVGTVITVEVYATTGSPALPTGAVLASGTLTLANTTPAPRWESVTLTSGAGSWPNNTSRAVVVSASANITLYTYTSSYATKNGVSYNGTVWSDASTAQGAIILPMTSPFGSASQTNPVHIVEFNGTVWMIVTHTKTTWNSGNYWDASIVNAGSGPNPATGYTSSVVEFNSLLYLGHSDTAEEYYTVNTGGSYGSGTVGGVYFAKAGGFLWKAINNDLAYTGDGTTWTDITDAAPPGETILAMAGRDQYLYFATRRGLYYVAPGDFVVGLMPWHSGNNNTTVKMTEWQGDIYVVSNNLLFRIDSSHTVVRIPVPTDDPQLDAFGRTIQAICPGMTYLYVATSGTSGTLIWAWSPEGWHTVAQLPETSVMGMCLSRVHEALWIATDRRVWRIRQTDTTINPYRDSLSRYNAHGWLETDKFHTSVARLQKDFESVYIDGQNFTSGRNITLYYKYHDDTDWVSLGSVTSVPSETRWLLASGRDGTYNLRLGVLMATNDRTATPRLEVVSTKYVPMVNDRKKWNLVIKVAPEIKALNGELLVPSATFANEAALVTHLQSCISSVVPVIYRDVDGTYYEVKVTAPSGRVERFEVKPNDTKQVSWLYYLEIEQIQNGTYTPP